MVPRTYDHVMDVIIPDNETIINTIHLNVFLQYLLRPEAKTGLLQDHRCQNHYLFTLNTYNLLIVIADRYKTAVTSKKESKCGSIC